jgi:hypothetical protein
MRFNLRLGGLVQMKLKTNNPERNRLPPGIAEDDLIKGIEKSGYPLQSVVAERLVKRGYSVTEEWGYADRDSGEPRSLDVLASSEGRFDLRAEVVPSIVLMIECKKSEHPFIFFRMVTRPDMPWFPSIFGLPHQGVSLKESKNPERHELAPASRALGLSELPFVSLGTDRAASFSQAIPHGKKVDLSGAEAFNHLILPLSKAADHARSVYGHGHGPGYGTVFPRAALSIAVLDAPMILIEGPDRVSEPIYTPWVRIVRQEPNVDRFDGDTPFKHYAIDAVHIDFFDKYLEDELTPFTQHFSHRARNLGDIFIDGGEVPNLDSWNWNEITRWSGAPARLARQ